MAGVSGSRCGALFHFVLLFCSSIRFPFGYSLFCSTVHIVHPNEQPQQAIPMSNPNKQPQRSTPLLRASSWIAFRLSEVQSSLLIRFMIRLLMLFQSRLSSRLSSRLLKHLLNSLPNLSGYTQGMRCCWIPLDLWQYLVPSTNFRCETRLIVVWYLACSANIEILER